MVDELRNYYEILGLSRNASVEEIRKSYINLAKIYHPDHNVNTQDRRMIELNQIYEILSNPVKRQEYDARFIRAQTYDFTGPKKESVTPQKKERVVKHKVQGIRILKLLLLIIVWVIVVYLVFYFIVNILAMYITMPVWLLSLFPL
ncbi:MAG: J domain-containing protein [Dehalococcoidales bacterium]|nr:J domain-containing protein [Dehalococcoidales bacterium]